MAMGTRGSRTGSKQSSENQLVPYLSEYYTPLARLAMGYVSIVKATYEVVSREYNDELADFDEKIKAYITDTDIRCFREVADFFNRPSDGDETGEVKKLKTGHPSDALIAKSMYNLTSILCEALLKIWDKQKIEDSPLNAFLEFKGSLKLQIDLHGSDPSKSPSFAKAIKSKTIHFKSLESFPTDVICTDNDENSEIDFTSLPFGDKIKQDGKTTRKNHSAIDRLLNNLCSCIAKWLSEEGRIANLDTNVPGITLDQEVSWKFRYCNLDRTNAEQNDDYGLFYVVREARGVITSHARDSNLIIRDLLWLRSFNQNLAKEVFEDESGRNYEHGGALGFYYSVMDGLVYEVKKIMKRNDVIMIDAVAHLDNDEDLKSLCLYFPQVVGSVFEFSIGTVMGAVSNQSNTQRRSGAWASIVVRPEITQTMLNNLDREFCLYAEAFSRMPRREYNPAITKFAHRIESCRLAGILSSRMIISESKTTAVTKAATEAEEAFREVYSVPKKYEREVDSQIEKIVQTCKNADGNLDDELVLAVVKKLIVQEYGYTIAPISVYKSELREDGHLKMLAQMRVLAKKGGAFFFSHAEYRAACAGGLPEALRDAHSLNQA